MSFKILFPGNNKIGEVSASKLDPNDDLLGEFQGLVGCVNKEGKDIAGIILSDEVGYSTEVMDVLLADVKGMKIIILSSRLEDAADDIRQVSVKISMDREDSKTVDMYFDVTKDSLDRYVELSNKMGVSWFMLKCQGLVMLVQFEIVSGFVCFREIELLH